MKYLVAKRYLAAMSFDLVREFACFSRNFSNSSFPYRRPSVKRSDEVELLRRRRNMNAPVEWKMATIQGRSKSFKLRETGWGKIASLSIDINDSASCFLRSRNDPTRIVTCVA